jgi:hypothetical protein
MEADTEAAVVQVLTDAGYWTDERAWRNVGDIENNYSAIGNQQSEAIAALIEKVINGVDARLMDSCSLAGIDPAAPEAPHSIREAVARFFEHKDHPDPDRDGRIANWNNDRTTEQGRLLTVAATGHMPDKGQPSISIADQGEGQEPDEFPNTFMSLSRANKLRVHFVQGKYNMGGTGALQFCGKEHNVQLIVSRRDPALVPPSAPARAREWGFTVVRREPPTGGRRSSVFTYLAPVGATATRPGEVLSFAADAWPIFPEANEKGRGAYLRGAPYGSLVKLYEYQWQGPRSNIVYSGGGLLRRIDAGLPELALPVRVFECRPGYKGHSGSFATNVLGLGARLDRDRASNLEEGFPINGHLTIEGSRVKVRIFAFKPGRDKDYRTNRQGVIFSVNGQSHATLPTDLFRKKAVGMSYLSDALLVLVDCSGIDGQMREDLFMNSRDRLRDTPVARKLETEIEMMLASDPTLKALRNRRREAEIANKLEDSRPLSNVLKDLLKNQPTLAKLFLQGVKIASPFPPGGGAGHGSAGAFHGKTYPTFFRFKDKNDGEHLTRAAHIGSRTRIAFETDADDEYFARDLDPGAYELVAINDGVDEVVMDYTLRDPHEGIATLTLPEAPAGVALGTRLEYRLRVTDPSRIDAFVNEFTLVVRAPQPPGGGGTGRATTKNSATGASGGGSLLSLPTIIEVTEDKWHEHEGFNEMTALVVKSAGGGDEGSDAPQVYDFYINVDNKYLRLTEKESKEDPKLLKAKFLYGLVLIGLALLQEERVAPKPRSNEDGEKAALDVERLVERTSRAVAPVLLPMLESIGALNIDDED